MRLKTMKTMKTMKKMKIIRIDPLFYVFMTDRAQFKNTEKSLELVDGLSA